jgi:2-hydroxychromene-2-carboxylate isomerase
MSLSAKDIRKKERSARLMIWMAARSSRNQTFIDRLCRKLIERATAVAPEDDFMRDPLIDNDEGFDPDELDRYQRGEIA